MHYIKINQHAAIVHITKTIDENGVIDYPLCGAPGNTISRAKNFSPVIVDKTPTCKRCLKFAALTAPEPVPEPEPEPVPEPEPLPMNAARALRNFRDFGALAAQFVPADDTATLVANGWLTSDYAVTPSCGNLIS